MKTLITQLSVFILLCTLAQSTFGQTIMISDFLRSQKNIPYSAGINPSSPCGNPMYHTYGPACDAFLLTLPAVDYDDATSLITAPAFNQHVLRNFQYTIAGQEKTTNGVTLDLAAPKVKITGTTSLQKGSVYLRTEFNGGLSDDSRFSPIYTGNNFTSSLGASVGVAWLPGGNKSNYNLDGNVKKMLHIEIVNYGNATISRADTLIALQQWYYNTFIRPIPLAAVPGTPGIFDFFTKNLTQYERIDPASGHAQVPGFVPPGGWNNTFIYFTYPQRLGSFKLQEYLIYLAKFRDIEVPASVLASVLTVPNGTANFSFLDDRIASLQDSLARQYWTRDKMFWWSGDINFKHQQLNQISNDGVSDKRSGLPFHDLGLTLSWNYLTTNPQNRTRFLFFRPFIAVGRGTNSRSLRAVSIDKNVYYAGDLAQLTYGSFGFEFYGNAFKVAGLPGLYINLRADYSASYKNPWIVGIEGGPLFNLQDKRGNNFVYIIPTFGFTDFAEPGIDVSDNFVFSLKLGIPVNIRYR